MERYQVILGYDGTAFGGMQRQNNAVTVQGELENALRKIGWQGSSVLVAGRTDAGVHASGQVVAFDFEWKHSPEDLCNALNANLPLEIAVNQAKAARPDFHPRFDATARSYEYCIICRPTRDPLRERYTWRVWPQPEMSLLKDCAGKLIGVRDFAAFGTSPQEGGTTTREIFSAEWRKAGDELSFKVSANAFLYHMVRRMVNLQVEIGLGKKPINVLDAALTEPQMELIQGLAPANGLFLRKVEYPE